MENCTEMEVAMPIHVQILLSEVEAQENMSIMVESLSKSMMILNVFQIDFEKRTT